MSEEEYQINTKTYDWVLRSFSVVKKLLKVNIKLHYQPEQLLGGDIFLFNHFARFETFIPQYLFHREQNIYCRSVAAAEFFAGNDTFANFLRSIGAVPNNHPRLIPFLAKEVLHGRKVIVFPEGGMVKDKKVLDEKGNYRLYSRSAHQYRKQHTGAAVLALALDTFKTAVLHDYAAGNLKKIEQWASELGFDDINSLLLQAIKPTNIVPANITFYPIRVDENVLLKSVELLSKGISKRFIEELTIEGNILLKHTDMDIRLGKPINVGQFWYWWEKKLLPNVAHRYSTLDELFSLKTQKGNWRGLIHSFGMKHKIEEVRDYYMEEMYQVVTVHLSHLASSIIEKLLQKGINKILKVDFHKILYLSVKYAQQEASLCLHRSLQNPEEYGLVLEGKTARLEQFLHTVKELGLISSDDSYYIFKPKLTESFGFDEIRTENLVAVYANEVQPLQALQKRIKKAIKKHKNISDQQLALYRFDDQKIAFDYDCQWYCSAEYDEINQQETKTADANWFFLHREKNKVGVLLLHGFLASPAEMRSLGDLLFEHGYNVLGVRLKGHGTSPADLKQRSWQDWYQAVWRGYKILLPFCDHIHVCGFSTGGSLALLLASEHPQKLQSVVAVSSLLKFQNKNIAFAPLIHQANKWIGSIFPGEGIKPYVENHPEHPEVNYQNIPVKALYELTQLIDYYPEQLARVRCPVSIFYGDKDPVVDPQSSEIIMQKLPQDIDKQIHIIKSEKHGIVYENIGNIQQKILQVFDRFQLAEGARKMLEGKSES